MRESQIPIPDHLNDFLDWLDVEKGLSSKSQENYSRFLKKFIDWLGQRKLSALKPHELTTEHIWDYRVFLARSVSPIGAKKNRQLKKTTQNYYLIALRSLLKYFADRDIVTLPSEKIKLARDKSEKQIKFLDLDQLEKLFETPDLSKIQGLRDRAILEIFFSTGMRISELTSLNREQIPLKIGAKDLELSIKGKGEKVRVVYISERALNWLMRYLAARTDMNNALFVSNSPRNETGAHRLTNRAIEKKIKRYSVEAGLPLTTTPHVMRHSFATDLLSQGVDLRVVQEFLGHRNIAATQIYTHVTNKRLREIHKKFHGNPKLS